MNSSDMDQTSTSPSVTWCSSEQIGNPVFLTVFSCFSVLILLGLMGNIIVFITLETKCMKTVTNYLLKQLSVLNALFLFISSIFTALRAFIIGTNNWKLVMKAVKVEAILTILMMILHLASIWQLVTVGLMQCITIYRPDWAKVYCSIRTACLILFINVVTSVLLHIPIYGIYMGLDYITVFYESHRFASDSYMHFLFGCLYFLIPIGLLIAFNVAIIHAMYRKLNLPETCSMNAAKRVDFNDVTKAIVSIIVIFLVTSVPMLIALVDTWYAGKHNMSKERFIDLALFTKGSHINCTALTAFVFLFGFLPFLNAGLNCVVYLIVRKSFRESVKELCGCHRREMMAEELMESQTASQSESVGTEMY